MPRGRPRKSLEDHIRDGTYRRDRHGPLPGEVAAEEARRAAAERAAGGARGGGNSAGGAAGGAAGGGAEKAAQPPRKPETLPAAQSELWDELSRLLAGVVTERDASMLMEACWWWAELRRVQAVLREMVPGAKGYKDTLIGAGICTTNLDRILCRFGMTPADRSKLKAEASGPVAAKVPTRPKTKLDAQGPPKG